MCKGGWLGFAETGGLFRRTGILNAGADYEMSDFWTRSNRSLHSLTNCNASIPPALRATSLYTREALVPSAAATAAETRNYRTTPSAAEPLCRRSRRTPLSAQPTSPLLGETKSALTKVPTIGETLGGAPFLFILSSLFFPSGSPVRGAVSAS